VTESRIWDTALERLARSNPRRGRVVELRFYGGLSIDELSRELALATHRRR
jgi:hypothetical protein